MRWYFNPKNWWTAGRETRRIRAGGGPREVSLNRIGEPEGWILPTSTLELEVVAKDGTKANFDPAVPVPWPLAYAYRAARKLNAPIVRSLDLDNLGWRLRRPGA